MRASRLLVLLAGGLVYWMGIQAIRAQDTGGDVPAAPTSLQVAQIDYGAQGTILLEWTSPQLYETIELLVDGEIVEGPADGAALKATVLADPGTHAFGVRGVVSSDASEETSMEFVVLESSPVPDPIVNLECEFVPGAGGLLRVRWTAGSDAWVSGELRVPGFTRVVAIEPEATEAEITAGDEHPHVALLTFRSAEGYDSRPYTPLCLAKIPAFRRGDCDRSGRVNITDAVFTLNHLFRGGPRWFCDDACDANDDGKVNISDAIASLMYLFAGGGELPRPGPYECGVDLSEDLLGGLCSCP